MADQAQEPAKEIDFELPEGMQIPGGISAQGEFNVLATIRLKDPTHACLVAVDGNRLPGYQGKPETSVETQPQAKDDKRGYAQAASDAMDGGGY